MRTYTPIRTGSQDYIPRFPRPAFCTVKDRLEYYGSQFLYLSPLIRLDISLSPLKARGVGNGILILYYFAFFRDIVYLFLLEQFFYAKTLIFAYSIL